MGRQAAGVIGIRMRGDDRMTSMEVVEEGGDLLVVTTQGIGKRTPLKEYNAKGRGTYGVKTINTNAIGSIGKIASARVVQKEDHLTMISTNGVVLRTKVKNISTAGRATKGVILMDLGMDDTVASVARIAAADLKKVGVDSEDIVENGETGENKNVEDT
jgi:DNA gyrase subunit A